MNTQELIVTQCSHPQLVSWRNFPHDEHFRCTHCGKELSIDTMRLVLEEIGMHVSHQQENRAIHQRAADLIGETFGEPWREKVLRESAQWTAR